MPNQAPLTTPLTGSNIVSPETATDARHPSTAQEAAETSNASSDAAPDLEKNVGPPSHQSSTRKAADPNIVDFDGPDDPMKAVNWPRRKKWNMVALLSAMTFITPLASSMFAPGIPEVQTDFHSDDSLLAGFVVSVYILGYASGPLVIAPLSELYGRTIVYNVSNLLFVIFTIACAVSSSLDMLIGFRYVSGLFGSTVITIGGGTIADLFIQEERGRAMSLWSLGPLLGPVVGPVAGGFLAESEGWRWVFWVIAITAGVIGFSFFIFQQETYSMTILEKKARRLRKETNNPALRSKLASAYTPAATFKRSIVRPLKMLVFQPIVLLLAVFMAVVYGYLYLLFTTFTRVFEGQYGFSPGIAGLTYLGVGIGNLVGVAIFAALSDRYLKSKKAKGIEMRPEDRLPFLIPGSFLLPMGLLIYGWTAEYKVHYMVPIVLGTGNVGVALLGIFMPIQTYLVDAFTVHASSAIAANTVLRSLFGAVLPLGGQPMYDKLGVGWGNSLLAFIAIAMIPIPFLLIKYGERIRTSERFKVEL